MLTQVTWQLSLETKKLEVLKKSGAEVTSTFETMKKTEIIPNEM